MELSSEQISRYLQELRRDTKNREYVAVIPESGDLGFSHFAWISENYCEAKPRQHPGATDILAVAVENLTFRKLVTTFSVVSEKGKVLFGMVREAGFVRKLTVPPKRGPNAMVVGDKTPISLATLNVLDDILGVKASTHLGADEADESFDEQYDILLRFSGDA